MEAEKKILENSTFEMGLKWLLLILGIGVLVGSASAIFLWLLDAVVNIQYFENWLMWFLPLGGLAVGLAYHYWGKEVNKGNNLLLEEIDEPKKVLPFRMAPMVLLGTLISHLLGASVGREGTAVQMGGAIADKFTQWFRLNNESRRVILVMGISAGFASVFGTPLAGAIFSLEVMAVGKLRWKALLPAFAVAFVAHYACMHWEIKHTQFHVQYVPDLIFTSVFWTVVLAILAGFCAWLFVYSGAFFKYNFERWIKYPPLRPFVGGIILAIAYFFINDPAYFSLGVGEIQDAFGRTVGGEMFILKLLLTAFAVNAGFKGGEVTPLFFIGATLGSALTLVSPMPVDLFAAIGLVAVFAGATNTPLACAILGVELFGIQGVIYYALATVIAYHFSGKKGIYSSHKISWKEAKMLWNFKK